jgi:hypothetical protein
LIPYRHRPAHLATLLAALHPHLDRQHREHDVFVVEQADRLLFNRGALLNAAALLLQGSSYDYFCFQVGCTVGQLFLLGGCRLQMLPAWALAPQSADHFQNAPLFCL